VKYPRHRKLISINKRHTGVQMSLTARFSTFYYFEHLSNLVIDHVQSCIETAVTYDV